MMIGCILLIASESNYTDYSIPNTLIYATFKEIMHRIEHISITKVFLFKKNTKK